MTTNISNRYDGGKVVLDNNSFTNCSFSNCELEFSGKGPVGMTGCEFNNVRWVFSGPAENTLNFLSAMYNGMGEGGKQVVEATFADVTGKHL